MKKNPYKLTGSKKRRRPRIESLTAEEVIAKNQTRKKNKEKSEANSQPRADHNPDDFESHWQIFLLVVTCHPDKYVVAHVKLGEMEKICQGQMYIRPNDQFKSPLKESTVRFFEIAPTEVKNQIYQSAWNLLDVTLKDWCVPQAHSIHKTHKDLASVMAGHVEFAFYRYTKGKRVNNHGCKSLLEYLAFLTLIPKRSLTASQIKNFGTTGVNFDHEDKTGHTALLILCKYPAYYCKNNNDLIACIQFLAKHSNPSHRNHHDENALQLIHYHWNSPKFDEMTIYKAMKALIENGASPIPENDDDFILTDAMLNQHTKLTQYLLDRLPSEVMLAWLPRILFSFYCNNDKNHDQAYQSLRKYFMNRTVPKELPENFCRSLDVFIKELTDDRTGIDHNAMALLLVIAVIFRIIRTLPTHEILTPLIEKFQLTELFPIAKNKESCNVRQCESASVLLVLNADNDYYQSCMNNLDTNISYKEQVISSMTRIKNSEIQIPKVLLTNLVLGRIDSYLSQFHQNSDNGFSP